MVLELRVYGLGLRFTVLVYDLGFRVWVYGFGLDLGFRVYD